DDPAFAAMMRAYFDGEAANCEAITPALHRKRSGIWARIVQALSFFLVTSADYTVTRRLNFGRA
ncbi:MAG: phosphatidylserine/phosphatidylglycerophosphate/cardiolipin synthase family protein, partial [Sphingomicrobium sp.]